ncbi:hypothetical protein, partial [Streptococcus suis]|uniref:hypothetical protein n=1 Tax=Streptococcus suis TaxID=1307 RepID=UPI000CF52450
LRINVSDDAILSYFLFLYSMKIKSSLGNEVQDRTGVHQGKLTKDNFDFRRVLDFLTSLIIVF